MTKQVSEFRRGGGDPVCIGIVGINCAPVYTSYEGDRAFPTDGKKYVHPIQEALTAEERLRRLAKPAFDDFLILRYRATNVDPYPFEWVDYNATVLDYGAVLVRVSREYYRRFGRNV